MQKYSIEIVPKQIERLKYLPRDVFTEVYVAYIPGEKYENIVEASKSLIKDGFNVIPHCPARTISSKKELDSYLSQLSFIGVKKILTLAGSGNNHFEITKNPNNIFSNTLEMLETGLFEKYQFEQINIAGHPEGNPMDPESDKNLQLKCQWLHNHNFNSSIVTQWTTNLESTNKWILDTKEMIKSKFDNKISITIGIAGPAKLTTLINYAKICGVDATSMIIKNKKLSLRHLVKHNPTKIISELRNYDSLHFFPFGGIREICNWVNGKVKS
jgi:methylenetetrahydrofolate reductase (NADPH)